MNFLTGPQNNRMNFLTSRPNNRMNFLTPPNNRRYKRLLQIIEEATKKSWGVKVKAGQTLKVDSPEGYIHISEVKLTKLRNTMQDGSSESVEVYLNIDDQKYLLGTLVRGRIVVLRLNLIFLPKEFELSHNSQNSSVCFAGYEISRTSVNGRLRNLSNIGDDLALTGQENDRAQTLVRKGKNLRLKNKNLKGCIRNLSKAISIMLRSNTSKRHDLFEAYCLRALCVQEDTPDQSERIVQDVSHALCLCKEICSMGSSKHSVLPGNLTILFYNIIDLLHLKGFNQLFDDAHSLLIQFSEHKKIKTKKFLTTLWETRRLNHAFCISPINEAFVGKNNDANSWLQCLKGSKLALAADEVSKIADKHDKIHTSVVSAYIYIDLSRQFVSSGQLEKALFNVNKARNLVLLDMESSLSGIKRLTSDGLDECLSIRGSKMESKDTYPSHWKILQCYFETRMQLGIVHELMGNAKQSEQNFNSGKQAAKLFHFPLFMVAFSTLLGKLYIGGCIPRFLSSSEEELKYACDIIEHNKGSLGCSKCISMFRSTLYELHGDELQIKIRNASEAEEQYTKALNEIYSDQWKNSVSFPIDESEVIKSGSLSNYIDLKWEIVQRRLSLELHSRIVKSKLDTNELDETCKQVLSKGISALVGTNFLHALTSISKDHFSQLVTVNTSGDIFAIERANLILVICEYLLRYPRSEFTSPEFTSDIFCDGSSVKFEEIISWLRVAFVLSREVPVVFQKVSRLLAMLYAVLRSIKQLSLSCPNGDFGENYWSAYFHQASIGTHLTYKFHSHFTEKFKGQCGTGSSSIKQDKFDSFGLVPNATEDLENHMEKVLAGLPSSTIICISILGWDYTTLLKNLPISPPLSKDVRAVLLISRLCFGNEPVVILLPLYSNPQEKLNKDSVIDDILQSFTSITKGTILTEPTMDFLKDKMILNNILNKRLSDAETSWLGFWKCLLLGERVDSRRFDFELNSLANDGRSSKLTKELLKIILGGEEREPNLSSNKHYYIASIGYDAWLESLSKATNVIKQEFDVREGSLNRKPVMLVLDYELQGIPWESFPVIRTQEIYRMPSVSSIFVALYQRSNQEQVEGNQMTFPSIDPLDTFYILCPDDKNIDFSRTEKMLKTLEFKGKSDSIPNNQDVVCAMKEHDLYLYIGHGDGRQYKIDFKEIEKLEKCAAVFLIGCESGCFKLQGIYAPQYPSSISYLLAASPVSVAQLWNVTAEEVEKFIEPLFQALLEERTNQSQHKRTIGYFIRHALTTCSRPILTGGSTILYGLPTEIFKRK